MGSDGDDSTVFDVDLGVGAFGDALDGATTRTDHRADQLRVNAEAEQARSVRGQPLTWGVNGLEHFLENMQTSRAGLGDGLGDCFHRQAGDLHIHLQGGDAFFATRHLEVHVTQEVLNALDVSEDPNFLAFLDQTHGGTAHWSLERHTCIHQ